MNLTVAAYVYMWLAYVVCLEILWVVKEVKSNTVYPIAAKFITRRGIGEMYVAWV